MSSKEKISQVREKLTKTKAKAMVVNMLDEVAWLFNLRGSDIEYNPGAVVEAILYTSFSSAFLVFFAYAIVTFESVILFVDSDQIDKAVQSNLGSDIQLQQYNSFFQYLEGLESQLG